MNRGIFFALASGLLIIASAALAADVPVDLSPGGQAVGLICENQQLFSWLFGLLLVHLGASGGSALLKKFGISDNQVGNVVRLVALDLKAASETQAAAAPPPGGPKP